MRNEVSRDRPLTEEEKVRYAEVPQQIADELPEIKRRAQVARPRILLKHILNTLKMERERRGLSLDELAEKSGIDRELLSRMENDQQAEVTMKSLLQYAEAVGKTLTVQVQDCAAIPSS